MNRRNLIVGGFVAAISSTLNAKERSHMQNVVVELKKWLREKGIVTKEIQLIIKLPYGDHLGGRFHLQEELKSAHKPYYSIDSSFLVDNVTIKFLPTHEKC